MRRRNVRNAHERILKYDNIILHPKELLDVDKLFTKKQPIHLEIGMGKGKFIIEHAKRNPHINYIGFEKYESVILQALVKLEDIDLPNLVLVCADATNLNELFEQNSIDKIYLNFSDPWPKVRHAKRRLTSPNFLNIYESIAKKPTLIEFKTDNRGLFEYSLVTFNEQKYHFNELSLDLHKDKEDIITTEYEDKFSSQGNPIYYVQVEKC
ncbi:MAG: tRNA (guanosine(46)-N7)-methyltransferase TrmB [Bacilli bacterium]|nr:tRNA (guanosine(46)-N7)-methyltransferase TrmB [Bacilli bacterium]